MLLYSLVMVVPLVYRKRKPIVVPGEGLIIGHQRVSQSWICFGSEKEPNTAVAPPTARSRDTCRIGAGFPCTEQ